MWRPSILQKLLVSGVAVITTTGVFSPQMLAANPAEAHPKTVQVKPGGAQIYSQPKSGGEVIGEYKPGIILSPKLKVFSNEGQVWLKVGDHWVPEESFTVIEGAPPNPTASTETTIATPASSTPTAASPTPAPAPAGTLPAPPAPAPAMAVIVAENPEAGINVRSQPTTESNPVLAVKPGDRATVIKQTLGKDTYTWYNLEFVDSKTKGWVRGDFVEIKPQAKATPTAPQSLPQNVGSITAPVGMFVTLQTTPAEKTATPHKALSGQKVKLLKMVKGEDGLAWYEVQFLEKAEAKGWVRGNQVRLLANFAQPRTAVLSAPAGRIIEFYSEPTLNKALPLRGISGEQVKVLQQVKGDNGYAWYSVQVSENPRPRVGSRGII